MDADPIGTCMDVIIQHPLANYGKLSPIFSTGHHNIILHMYATKGSRMHAQLISASKNWSKVKHNNTIEEKFIVVYICC